MGVDDMELRVVDLGGHREYECSLPLMNRDNKVQNCVIQPSDCNSKESLDEALGDWMDVILNYAVQPHFMVTVSRIDELPVEGRESKIAEMAEILKKYLSDKKKQVEKRRSSFFYCFRQKAFIHKTSIK